MWFLILSHFCSIVNVFATCLSQGAAGLSRLRGAERSLHPKTACRSFRAWNGPSSATNVTKSIATTCRTYEGLHHVLICFMCLDWIGKVTVLKSRNHSWASFKIPAPRPNIVRRPSVLINFKDGHVACTKCMMF